MTLYPIILFAYNRPWHTEQVLQALKRNELADQSHLIIFMDGPKIGATDEQIKKIEAVRDVVKRENWCGSVEYHIAVQNIGCRDSIINGITQTLNKYEAVIVLEDDIVTSPNFLQFMNKCLNYYQNYKSVFSISGMTLPAYQLQMPKEYNFDVYVSLRQLNSGWATWSDRWKLIDWDLNFVDKFIKQNNVIDAYNRGGDDLVKMLIEQVEGKTDAWDIQFTFNHFKHHAVSIIPCISYVDNIGGDGSGTHHSNKDVAYRFNVEKAVKNPKLLEIVYEDKQIINMFYSAFCSKKRPLWKKIINRLNRKLNNRNVFVIKKKIYE